MTEMETIASVAEIDLSRMVGPLHPDRRSLGFRGLWIAVDGRVRAFPTEAEALQSMPDASIVHYEWATDLPFEVER